MVEYDLKIVPVLWKFDSHAEFSTPIAALDADGLTKWLDDRIVGFVELYIQIHEGEFFDKAEYRRGPRRQGEVPEVRRRGYARTRRADVLLHRREHEGRVRQAEGTSRVREPAP